MKKITSRVAALFFIGVLISSLALAGGYQINEHGARATGMGGAFVAQSSDGSAMYFNAAGLGFQKGFNVLVGTTLIFPSTSFTGPSPATTKTDMESQMFYPSNLYASYAVDEQWVVGLGIYNPYGLGTEWPETWRGRTLTVKTDLQTFYINPTIAYKVSDQVSFGAGFSLVLGNATLKRSVQTGAATYGTSNLEGDGSGACYNVGLLFKPAEKLSIGASYRSLVEIELSGTASFTGMGALQPLFPGGEGKVSLPMPSNAQVGAAYEVTPELTVECDFQLIGWSSYDKLSITLASGPAGPGGQPLQQSPPPQEKNWTNGKMVRLGGEYKLNEQLALRAGYIMDFSPQPTDKVEPMLPDAYRNDVTIGGSYKINENLFVDASFMMVLFEDRTSTLPGFSGTYKSSASLISANIGYSF